MLPEETPPCVIGCLLGPTLAFGPSDILYKELVWFEAGLGMFLAKAADDEEPPCFKLLPSGLLLRSMPLSTKGPAKPYGKTSG
jgi:hypothetical protein